MGLQTRMVKLGWFTDLSSLFPRADLVKEKAQLLRTFAKRQASRELHERYRAKEARRALHDPQSERYARMTPVQIVESVKSRTQWQPLNDHEAAAFFQLGWTLPRVEELRQKQLGGQQ